MAPENRKWDNYNKIAIGLLLSLGFLTAAGDVNNVKSLITDMFNGKTPPTTQTIQHKPAPLSGSANTLRKDFTPTAVHNPWSQEKKPEDTDTTITPPGSSPLPDSKQATIIPTQP